MSVIHVSEEEAARESGSLIEKVRAGVEVRIDRADETVAVLRGPELVGRLGPSKLLSV